MKFCKVYIISFFLFIALLSISCSLGGAQGAQIAFVTNNTAPFWTIARKGVEKADSELPNVSVDFKMPADGTAAEQKRIVDELLAKGVKGFAMSPVDPASQTHLIDSAVKQAFFVSLDYG